jgi:hypothetical protein
MINKLCRSGLTLCHYCVTFPEKGMPHLRHPGEERISIHAFPFHLLPQGVSAVTIRTRSLQDLSIALAKACAMHGGRARFDALSFQRVHVDFKLFDPMP